MKYERTTRRNITAIHHHQWWAPINNNQIFALYLLVLCMIAVADNEIHWCWCVLPRRQPLSVRECIDWQLSINHNRCYCVAMHTSIRSGFSENFMAHKPHSRIKNRIDSTVHTEMMLMRAHSTGLLCIVTLILQLFTARRTRRHATSWRLNRAECHHFIIGKQFLLFRRCSPISSRALLLWFWQNCLYIALDIIILLLLLSSSAFANLLFYWFWMAETTVMIFLLIGHTIDI